MFSFKLIVNRISKCRLTIVAGIFVVNRYIFREDGRVNMHKMEEKLQTDWDRLADIALRGERLTMEEGLSVLQGKMGKFCLSCRPHIRFGAIITAIK